MASGHWMQGAVKHPGAFTRKAKAAKMSIAQYAAKVMKKGSTASSQTKRQANLARIFARYRRKKSGG